MGESWGEDAFTSLAQLAAVTSRIRIGTSIVQVFARTPANIAMTALNLDRMSEGRFFLGLGTSGKSVIEDLHGETFRKPLTRMREYIDIIRKATRGERLDHVVLGLDARNLGFAETVEVLRRDEVLVDEHEHSELLYIACQSRPL